MPKHIKFSPSLNNFLKIIKKLVLSDSMLKKYWLFIFPKASSSSNKHIFVRAKSVCLLWVDTVYMVINSEGFTYSLNDSHNFVLNRMFPKCFFQYIIAFRTSKASFLKWWRKLRKKNKAKNHNHSPILLRATMVKNWAVSLTNKRLRIFKRVKYKVTFSNIRRLWTMKIIVHLYK